MFFNGYLETFLDENNISYDADKMAQRYLDREKRIREIMKDIFKLKYGVDMEESELGKLIMNSYSFMTDDQIDYDKLLYNISFNDKDSVRIDFVKNDIMNGVAKIIIESKGDEIDYNNDEFKTEIANAIGVDEVHISGWSRVDENHIAIKIYAVEYVVDTDKLEDFDFDKEYKDIQAKAEAYSKMQLEANQEVER